MMGLGEILVAGTLCCFAIGWCWATLQMLRTYRPPGKSAPFVMFTVTGYVFGFSSEFFAYCREGVLCPVTKIYLRTLAVTAAGLSLVLYFGRARRPADPRPVEAAGPARCRPDRPSAGHVWLRFIPVPRAAIAGKDLMISMKYLPPPAIVVLMALSIPATAQGDPELCIEAPGQISALARSGGLPDKGCPKVRIYNASGHARTACVLYFSDEGGEDTGMPVIDATRDGQSPVATLRTLLAY